MNEEGRPDATAIAEEYAKFCKFLGSNETMKAAREEVRTRMGQTPRDEIFREHSVTLYRYRRSRPASRRLPLLVIPSLVNKPVIMDLLPDQSFVGAMLERGLDVFMLEWGEPTPGQKHLTLDYYVNHYIGRAVRRILRLTGAPGLSLAGYCLGGSLALVAAACDGGRSVHNLITMVTPANFEDRGLLSWWSKEEHFDIDKVVDTYGNVPADFFSSSFPWLVPTSSLTKMRTLYERHEDEKFMESFLALDIWITENTAFPGEVYRQIIKYGYQQNVLVKKGAWPLDEGEARMADVRMPVLNLAADYDHISPVESCTMLPSILPNAACTSKSYPAGHLGIALGKDILGNHTEDYWHTVGDWLADHDA